MIKHDLNAELHVPVEILVEENMQGTSIVWQQPSGLIAGYEGAKDESRTAAEVLDKKLEELILDVLKED